jgi:hypothetical protein
VFLYETCGVGKPWCLISDVVYEKKALLNTTTISIHKPAHALLIPGQGYVLEVRVYNGAGFLWRSLTSAILCDDTVPTTGEILLINEASRSPLDVRWINTQTYVDFGLELGCYNWTDPGGNPIGQLGYPAEVLTNAVGATPLLGQWVDLESSVYERRVELYSVDKTGTRTLLRNTSLPALQAQCTPSDDVVNYDHYMRAVQIPPSANASVANATCLGLGWTLCEPFEALYGRWSIGHPTATQGWTSWNSDGTYSGFYVNMEDLPSSSAKVPPQDVIYALCCQMPRLFWTIPATFSTAQAKLNCNASIAPGELDGNITLTNKRLCSEPELRDLLDRYGLHPRLALESKFWIDRKQNLGYVTLRPTARSQHVWRSRASYAGEKTIIPYCCADRTPPPSGITRLRISQLQLGESRVDHGLVLASTRSQTNRLQAQPLGRVAHSTRRG